MMNPSAHRSFNHLFYQTFYQAFYFSLIGLALSVFVSISALTFFVSLVTLSSLVLLDWRAFFRSAKSLKLWPGFFLLAIGVNLLAPEPFLAVKNVVVLWPWPLLAFPVYFLFQEYERSQALTLQRLRWSAFAFFIGFGVAVAYALYGYFFEGFQHKIFWDLGRWRTFVGVGFLACLWVNLEILGAGNKGLKQNFKGLFFRVILPLMGTALAGICVLVSQGRTTYLALIVAVGVALVCSQVRVKILSILALFVGVSLGLNFGLRQFTGSSELDFLARFKQRFATIFQTQLDPSEGVTSIDYSAQARLKMWKVGSEMYFESPFSVRGFALLAPAIEKFFDTRGEDYFIRNRQGLEFGETDLHSSYLNSLLEMGIFFFLLFWGFCYWIFFRGLKLARRSQNRGDLLAVCVVSYYFVCFAFGYSYASFEMVFFVPALSYLVVKLSPASLGNGA